MSTLLGLDPGTVVSSPEGAALLRAELPSKTNAALMAKYPPADRLVGQNGTFSTALMPLSAMTGLTVGVLYDRARPVED